MVCGMEEAEVRRNLEDAGCAPEWVRGFMRTWETGAVCECARLLDSYRRALLEDIHLQEEKLTCLDYLRYRLKKPGTQRDPPPRRR